VPLDPGREETLFRSLSGVSAAGYRALGKTAFREAACSRHKGLSGGDSCKFRLTAAMAKPVEIDLLVRFAKRLGSPRPSKQLPGSRLKKAINAHLPPRLTRTFDRTDCA